MFHKKLVEATFHTACVLSVISVTSAIFLPLMPISPVIGAPLVPPLQQVQSPSSSRTIAPSLITTSEDTVNGGMDDRNLKLAGQLPQAEDAIYPVTRLLFIGDLMLARGVEWKIGKKGLDYPLKNVTDFLSAPDLTIGNFEGTIRDTPNQEMDGFTFDTTPTIAGILPKAGIDVVSLSNNHSDDYGASIAQYTRDAITKLGMIPFGDPYKSSDFVAHKTINNLTFAFIGFHAFGEKPKSIIEAIRTEKAAGNFVIVLPHWGNEYQFTPSLAQTDAAHLFIDSGADAVIGAHPHVIQTYENYLGKPIIYSLGNFLFDQDWSVPTQQGLAVEFEIDKSSITIKFVPINVIHSQVSIMEVDKAAKILAKHGLSESITITQSTNQNE